jgi:predicted O-linked N-acetylglucosamine transferase (SPINDLY family)
MATEAADHAHEAALAAHRGGELARAEGLYREALALAPQHVRALRGLGILHWQQGRVADGAECLRARLQVAGDSVQALTELAQAEQLLGRHSEVIELYQRAIALGGGNITVLNDYGISLAALGRFDRALLAFERALALDPTAAHVLNNHGSALARLGRHAEALQSFEAALAHGPETPDLLTNRGVSLAALGGYDEALRCQERALALDARHPATLINRGALLEATGRYEDAVASLRAAIALDPVRPEAYNNLGNALAALDENAAALSCYTRALELRADYPEALVHSGMMRQRLGKLTEAACTLDRALALQPEFPYAAGTRLEIALRCCDWGRLAAQIAAITERVRANERAVTPFTFLLCSASAADQLRCARVWTQDRCPSAATPLRSAAPRAPGRLRVAYLSPDFRTHPVGALTVGLFERHDRSRFETVGVALGPRVNADPLRLRLAHAFERFLDVSGMGDRAVAGVVRDLQADIAVDLAGLTLHSRPQVLALRPAPIQVSLFGYPGTLGAPHIDYLIADATVIPPQHEAHYEERIVRLPHTFFVTDGPGACAEAPSRAAAGLPPEAVVYCYFGGVQKLLPAVFDAWMQVLRTVDTSVLWLAEPAPLAAENLRREAQTRGVAAERVVFAPRLADPTAHLARLQLADLFLDTFPYNAHATAVDALSAGVPVLTCLGSTFAGRVGASLLAAMDLRELVTETLPEYTALAVALGRAPSRLAALRTRLARQRLASPLFDTDLQRKHLERAYLRMWELQQAGLRPHAFDVPA